MRVRLLTALPASGLRRGDELDVVDETARLWIAQGWAAEAKHRARPPADKAVRGPKETK